jgi:pimeloyl-ACP methyl ester carboxylesterase
MVDPSSCADCQSSFGCFSSPAACSKCEKLLCTKCGGKYALIVFDPSKPDESNDLTKNKDLKSFCKTCFQETSVLDFSKAVDVVEPNVTAPPNGITLLFAHGGGGNRAMFRAHAKVLAEKYGYRCILPDFPGHGTLVDKPLSPDTCADTIQSVLEQYNLKPGDKTIYIGGSLGAYVGFHVLKKHQEYFKGAILLDCGQNVGPGASLKATVGLWFLKEVTKHLSNKSITNLMMTATEKSPADYKLVETSYGSGFAFQQGTQQVECLKEVAPAKIIPELDLPILFFNGSEDYRDSEDKWLALCKDKRSELKVYDKGDHFFTHDSRFVDDMLERFDTFSKAVAL